MLSEYFFTVQSVLQTIIGEYVQLVHHTTSGEDIRENAEGANEVQEASEEGRPKAEEVTLHRRRTGQFLDQHRQRH